MENNFLTNHVLIAVTMAFTLILFFNSQTYAFHENLGIDDNKASELYHANPNDPAIIRWKNSLQSAIDAIPRYEYCLVNPNSRECGPFFFTIIANCKSHPNTLLGCNDSRLKQYVLTLKNVGSIPPSKLQEYATSVIEKCFSNPNSNTTFEVASPSCDTELLSLANDCVTNSSSYDYCKYERFLGYLTQHNILN
jgi:hypothetical protein